MPTAFAHLPSFVGRESELAYVRSRLREATLGEGSAVFFGGEDGIGKSRFLFECAELKAGATALSARCGAPEIPGHDLRAQLARQLGSDRRDASHVSLTAELAKALKHRPVAVFIDDVHLANDGEMELVDALVFLASRQRLAVVACYTSAVGRWNAGAERLQRWFHEGAENATLAPLSDAAVVLLARSLLKETWQKLDSDALDELLRAAQGNPRLAIELCSQRRDAGSTPFVPTSIYRSLESARASMSRAQFDVLLACSVIGERFRDEWVARIVDTPVATVARALQHACDLGILAEDPLAPGWYTFRRYAVRKAAYASVVNLERRLIHERIVERLDPSAGNGPPIPLIAGHWEALANHARAAELYVAAGDASRDAGSVPEAARLYEHATENLEKGSPAWLDVAMKLVICYRRLGGYDRMIAIVDSIRKNSDLRRNPNASGILRDEVIARLNTEDRPGALRAAEEIEQLDVLENPDDALSAKLAVALSYSGRGSKARAARLFGEVDPGGIETDHARFWYALANATIDANKLECQELERRMECAVEVSKRLGASAMVRVYLDAIDLAMATGRLDVGRAYRERIAELLAEPRAFSPVLHLHTAKTIGLFALLCGDLAATRASLLSILKWRESGAYNETFIAIVGVYLGVRSGEAALVEAMFDPALFSWPIEKRNGELSGLVLSGLAEVMQSRGMHVQLESGIRSCLEYELVDPWKAIHLSAARYGALGSLPVAEQQMEAYARETLAPIAPAHLALFRAIVAQRRGQLAVSQQHARIAARIYARLGWRLSEAAALELADAHRRAIKIYEECGAHADVLRVRAGFTRKLRRARFGAQLTPREREVAYLLARKRSDKEIANALEISVRTAQHHVEAILSKLGVAARTQVVESLLE
jgi:DNA-binding CsgD family transcriptional regulator